MELRNPHRRKNFYMQSSKSEEINLRKKPQHQGLYTFWNNKAKETDFINDIKKNPDLKQLLRYDTNFNNKRKVLFESLLAGIIRNNPRMLYHSVAKVAKCILPDFIEIFEKLKKAMSKKQETPWFCQHFYDSFAKNPDILAEYTGCYGQEISASAEEIEKFSQWIYSIITNTDSQSAYQKLLIIWEYGNFYIRLYSDHPELIPDDLGESFSQMKKLWDQSRANWPTNTIEHSRVSTQHTKRAKLTDKFGIFSTESNVSSDQILEVFPKVSMHLPGGNLWRVTSTSEFTREARFKLDMPLVASQSGSIALLLIPAIVIAKLNSEELRYFNLNAISFLIGNGHHSFHEFKTVWEAFNIPYVDGHYSSIFPDGSIKVHPDLLKLAQKFPDMLRSTNKTLPAKRMA